MKKKWRTSESGGQVQKRRRSGEMVQWLQGRIEVDKVEKELKWAEKREHMEAQQMQHVEILQVMQQTQLGDLLPRKRSLKCNFVCF